MFKMKPSPLGYNRILLLGASFATGNLGVNALAWSTIKIIKTQWPSSRIILVGSGREPLVVQIQMNGHQEEFHSWPVRYCFNLFARHHIAKLGVAVFLCNFIPFIKKRYIGTDSTLGEILRCDLVCDITGGDSFSDIYGLPRFLRGYLLKYVCQLTGKPFVLLPQTYGPFQTQLARILARQIFNQSQTIYSRDRQGLAVVQELIGPSRKVKHCPDVAFIMDSIRPDTPQVAFLEQLKVEKKQLIGLNISGLLYHGGYTQDNMFNLAGDYPELIINIISYFSCLADHHVLLVPHVLPASNFLLEDDFLAAKKVLQGLPINIQNKVVVLEKGYDQNETKFVISLCDFFIGSRMHATVAALSQVVPAVGMAYSGKFSGVFETAGVEDCVLDLRLLNNAQVLNKIQMIFARRVKLCEALEKTIPSTKNRVWDLFAGHKNI